MPDIVKISVRSLVEYVYRSGSIDSGFRTGTPLTEGTKAHQNIQKKYHPSDRKEVHLQEEITYDGVVFRIEGRCDGLLHTGDEVTVEEIKSTSAELGQITEGSHPVHWAQAVCYAYLYAKSEGLSNMGIRLTYVHVETEVQKQFTAKRSFDELESLVRDMVKVYAPFALMQLRHVKNRDRSIKELPFPYDAYRQGQRKFAGAVYKAIFDHKRLLAKAPTGTGKTISTLFPSVKAIGEGVLQRLFYLTAKTLTRTAAEESLTLMRRKGLQLRSVTVTAKEKICFQEEVRCQKEHCEFADGYYDRVNGALLDLLSSETLMTRNVLETYARKHRVCPFELSLDAAYAADAVICDYNYIYDPRISLKRLFEEHKRQTALLIDEAHNLVDRARDMFSAKLSKAPFLELKREYKARNPSVSKAAQAINDYFIAFRKKYVEQPRKSAVFSEMPPELVPLLEAFSEQAERELGGAGPGESGRLLLDTYYAAQSYIRIAGYYDERYVTYVELEKNDALIKLFCLDPSEMLRQMGKGYRSQIFFSATLSPISFYRDMLGAEADDYFITIPSPFSKDQLDVFIEPLSTRYRDRDGTKGRIAALLGQCTRERPGNYLVFFPSYEYMNEVYGQFVQQDTSKLRVLIQDNGMKEEDRESFMAAYQPELDKPVIGFAVMGGVFSEGIDLTEERLTGVVIVGVGLPQLGLERDIIKQYFDGTGKNGFDYAYVFPGMNKVLQAGGRLIRTERDRGTLVLVDDRFLQPKYQLLLPEEWKPAARMAECKL